MLEEHGCELGRGARAERAVRPHLVLVLSLDSDLNLGALIGIDFRDGNTGSPGHWPVPASP